MLENNDCNLGVYVIYDNSVEKFGLPFVAANDSNALRSIVSSVIHLDDNVIRDFELVEIGQYNVENANIEGHQLHTSVASGSTILKEVTKVREELNSIRKDALEELDSLKKLKMEAK